MTESDAIRDRSSGSPPRLRGVRLSCSQSGTGRQWGNQVWRNAHQWEPGFSGEDFITHRRILEVLGACLGKTQASCAFQVVAMGGKCMLGRSSDKMVPSLKNMGDDTRLLASLCL